MNIRYFIGFLILLFEMLSLGDISSQTLKINEFMAANSSTIKDPDYNEYADWIELFNYGNAEVNLRNFYITDNLNNPQKYKFTSDVIVPSLLHVSLRIFDILGGEAKVLVNEPKEQGFYEATFDGAAFPSGIYFAKMICGGFTKTIKMNLLK